MYDEIEDTEIVTEMQTPAPTLRSRRRWVSIAVIVGFSSLVAAAMFANRHPVEDNIDHAAILAEQAAYRSALTNASPSLRRARLQDFLNTYPNSDRFLAVKGQLQVIEQAEAADWAALSDVIFDTEQSVQVKRGALESYEDIWDTALLGGREAEVKRIRESLEFADEFDVDRDLPIDPESIPKGVSGEAMLGGHARQRRAYVPSRSYDFEPQSSSQSYSGTIVPPRIRRNRRPTYPSRALERGAEATIVLELSIDARGRVSMTELVSVEADRYERDFVRAAERAAKRMRYYPQTVNGTPVAVQGIEQTFHFEMDD